MRRSRFCFTEGTPPQCGIDFEPNSPKEHFVNCLVEDCEFDGNFSSGASFHIPHMNGKSRPLSVKFKNCRFSGNRARGFGIYATWNAESSVKGEIVFDGCLFAGNLNGGISLSQMPPKGAFPFQSVRDAEASISAREETSFRLFQDLPRPY